MLPQPQQVGNSEQLSVCWLTAVAGFSETGEQHSELFVTCSPLLWMAQKLTRPPKHKARTIWLYTQVQACKNFHNALVGGFPGQACCYSGLVSGSAPLPSSLLDIQSAGHSAAAELSPAWWVQLVQGSRQMSLLCHHRVPLILGSPTRVCLLTDEWLWSPRLSGVVRSWKPLLLQLFLWQSAFSSLPPLTVSVKHAALLALWRPVLKCIVNTGSDSQLHPVPRAGPQKTRLNN